MHFKSHVEWYAKNNKIMSAMQKKKKKKITLFKVGPKFLFGAFWHLKLTEHFGWQERMVVTAFKGYAAGVRRHFTSVDHCS